ncbi:acetyl esterase [Haladaptatus litoreus]|uniref:Acetyl esterase n=1 Tax=Haladaptatus litoreus TaxID=553468 RepID=A0A1N6XVN7_9EURY|nr:alpha/beta hydrolase [Haladaptatus litoreus]SIR06269.1 acetyl esterase [Haladaptatus litoreus]
MDDEMAAAVERIEAMGVPPWHAMSVESARRIEDDVFTPDEQEEIHFIRDLSIPGPEGDIPIRVYRPDVADAPVVVFYHGGGWVLGTLNSIYGVCRELAKRAECVVVSVDYRLAPEHPFPAGVDDAYAALEWVEEHAESFDGDPTKLGVAGTSAGGNLAAVTALRAREFDGPRISHQCLLYPITNHDFSADSYAENADGPLLTRADMAWFWNHYLRSPVDGANPFASPLRADDLSGLPPATIVTCGSDPLRDEGIAYADRLAEADVAVRHHHYAEMAHGFLSLTDSVSTADEAMGSVTATIRENLE